MTDPVESRERMREFTRRLPASKRTAPRLVYFILAPDQGAIKIGIASDVWGRMAQMQTGNPCELVMLGYLEPEHPRSEEAHLHNLFRQHHIRGEWFWCETELVDYIEARRIEEPVKPEIYSEPAWDPEPSLRPQIPPGVAAPLGNSRAARMARYKLARGLSA